MRVKPLHCTWAIAATLTIAVLAPACSKSETASKNDSEKILRFDNRSEPEYLDPGLLNDTTSMHIVTNLFEGLTTYHPKTLDPLPGVAERWEISPDGRTYTFYLRKDAKWTDGKPVVAGDFVYAWQRAVNPKTASRSAPHLYAVKNAQAINQGKITDLDQLGVRATGDKEVVVTLEAPFPPFLGMTADTTFMPVRQDVIEKHGDAWTRPENIVTNGPFMLTAWTPHKHIIIKKNPGYWDIQNVLLDGVVITPTEDQGTAAKLFEAKQVDFVEQVPINQVAHFKDKPEFANTELFAVYFYWINCTHPILKDARVRQALSMAIDRNVLVNQYLKALKNPANKGVVPPGVKDFPYRHYATLDFNPEKARQLLASAGYPDPSKIPELEILYNTNDDHKLIAEVIQQMLQTNLGIKARIQNMEWKVFLKELQKHKFEIARMGNVAEYVYPMPILETFVSGAEGNFGAYSNPQFDKLWAESLTTSNPSRRMALYAQMDSIIMNDLPVVPLYYYRQTTLLQSWVKGLYRNIRLVPIFKWVWLTPRDKTDRTWDTILEYTHIPWPKAV